MCSILWKFNLWLDKGKGSCNGKRGERWYHVVDGAPHQRMVNVLGIEKGI